MIEVSDESTGVWRLTGPSSVHEFVSRSLTTEDVAAALNVAPATIRAYNARGQMPPPSGRIGRTPYWHPDDIEPWLEQRRARASVDDDG